MQEAQTHYSVFIKLFGRKLAPATATATAREFITVSRAPPIHRRFRFNTHSLSCIPCFRCELLATSSPSRKSLVASGDSAFSPLIKLDPTAGGRSHTQRTESSMRTTAALPKQDQSRKEERGEGRRNNKRRNAQLCRAHRLSPSLNLVAILTSPCPLPLSLFSSACVRRIE